MNYTRLLLSTAAAALAFLIEAGHLAMVVAVVYDNEFTVFNCPGDENYTSAYGANLNRAIQMLHRYVDDSGFHNASVGQGIDRVYAMVLCRGDAQLDECKDCILESWVELSRSCHLRRKAIRLVYTCTLRYSNAITYKVMESEVLVHMANTQYATSPDQFDVDASRLLSNLTDQAASGGSLRKVEAGTINSRTIYGMVQCTPDLSRDDCARCLNYTFGLLSQHCGGKRGCRLFTASCNFRYEEYSWYNETRLRELEAVIVSPAPPVASTPTSTSVKDVGNTKTVIIIVVPIVLSLMILAVSASICFRNRRIQLPMENNIGTIDEISTPKSLQYAFSTIKTATNDFSDDNKLGEGGFGRVYKGYLPNGLEIAVKRLSMSSGQGDSEFKNEVQLLAKLQHRNLVRLLGFAIEGKEKLLVYELVQNASLEHFIFDQGNGSHLDWDRRYKIIRGIARGIIYLHEDSRLKIIHRDLKASNILLDREMNPKIADFGMARLLGQDGTHATTTRVAGTYGYMPPEYLAHGQFSIKSDVFSFGVMVLELISGRRNNNNFRIGESIDNLLSFAWKNWRKGTTTNVLDPLLRCGSGLTCEMLKCIHIGLLCVQNNPGDRPTMASVIIMLDISTIGLPEPNQPAFYFPRSDRKTNNLQNPNDELDHQSRNNDDTVTELHPR